MVVASWCSRLQGVVWCSVITVELCLSTLAFVFIFVYHLVSVLLALGTTVVGVLLVFAPSVASPVFVAAITVPPPLAAVLGAAHSGSAGAALTPVLHPVGQP